MDTCVFESLQYNFSSPLVEAFERACKSADVVLLVPDPINREIIRHIAERSKNALNTLTTARRKAPFLTKWPAFPSDEELSKGRYEINSIALLEWDQFKKRTEARVIGYESVNLNEIMNWYGDGDAPFGAGAKRKEFPDAFSIAILSDYAKTQKEFISIVSSDKDMANACKRYANFLYYDSLASLTEKLLLSSVNIDRLKRLVDSQKQKIELAITDAAMELQVFHDWEGITARLVEVTDCKLNHSNIVAFGENECTLAFEAEIEVGIELDTEQGHWWDEFNDADSYFCRTVVVEGVLTTQVGINQKKFTGDAVVNFEYGDFEAEVDLTSIGNGPRFEFWR